MQTPEVAFFMRLVEGEFPDYKQVIPGSTRSKVGMNREDFLGALRRMALLASERSHGVKLTLQKGILEVAASNPEQGEASDELQLWPMPDSSRPSLVDVSREELVARLRAATNLRAVEEASGDRWRLVYDRFPGWAPRAPAGR